MSGSVSSPFNLMSVELIDNTDGEITPARLRDIVETLAALPIYATTQTTSFTAGSLDMRGTMILVNATTVVNASLASNATAPFPVGTLLHFRPIGAGMIAFFAGSGATLASSSGTLTSRATGSWVTAHKTGTNAWFLDGDLA